MYQIKALEEFARKQYEKSRAPHKPLSDCLDHLRSKNGLPTGDHLDLDTFLYPNNNNNSNNNSIDARPDTPTRTRSPGPGPMTLSALLAQLFNAAAAAHPPLAKPPRKYRRKQAHPQIFIRPSSPSTSTATEPPTVVPGANIAIVEEAVDNEANDDDLKGYSKSEVTVIDTSSPGWKADMLVFRNDAVWKLKEKKPKSRVSSNKKSGNTGVNEIGTSEDHKINNGGEERL